jgi:acyl carrier protein
LHNIKNAVITVVRDHLFDIEITDEQLEVCDLIDDLGLDSITFIAIVVELESALNVTLDDENLVMSNFKTIDNICTALSQGKEALIFSEGITEK